MTKPKKMGRPTSYTPELAAIICERIVESDYGLEQICQADDLPSPRTIYRWLADHEDFRQQYAHAKEVQGHVQAERGLKEALTASDAAIGRLKWDARRWTASKLAPKVFGDKLELGGKVTLNQESALDELE
jgi:IS30 family transposase